MSNDDLDYFPRRKTVEEKEADRQALKAVNIQALRDAGLTFHEVNKSDVCVFRSTARPTVDYYPAKNRWQVRGNIKTRYGTVAEFIQFIRVFHLGDQP